MSSTRKREVKELSIEIWKRDFDMIKKLAAAEGITATDFVTDLVNQFCHEHEMRSKGAKVATGGLSGTLPDGLRD